MPIDVDFEFDKNQFRKLFGSMDRKSMRKVVRQAINKTVKNVQAEVSRQVRKDRAITKPKTARTEGRVSTPARFVRDRIKVKRIFSTYSINTMRGEINISGRGVSLIQYGARAHKQGVTVKIKRNGARKLIKGAFISKLKRGNVHVVRRINNTRKIKALYSTTIANAAETRMSSILIYARERQSINLNAAIGNHLRRSLR